MAAVAPSISASGGVEVYVAVEETVVLVDVSEALPSAITQGPLLRLAVSPSAKYLAGYGQDCTVHVWPAGGRLPHQHFFLK